MSKTWVIVLSLTFFVFITWLIIDLLLTKPSIKANPQLQKVLEPLDPDFDQEAISKIRDIKPIDKTPIIRNNPIQQASPSAN